MLTALSWLSQQCIECHMNLRGKLGQHRHTAARHLGLKWVLTELFSCRYNFFLKKLHFSVDEIGNPYTFRVENGGSYVVIFNPSIFDSFIYVNCLH